MADIKKARGKSKKLDPRTQAFRRSLFYAVTLFAVFQFMVIPLQGFIYPLFVMSAVVGYLVVIGELLFSTVSEYRRQVSFEIFHIRKSLRLEYILNHFVLPSLLYASAVLFLLFNRILILDQMAIVLVCVTFFILLYSISCTYLKFHSVARKFRLAFDFSKIIIFYFVSNSIVNFTLSGGYHAIFIYFGVFLTVFVLLYLMVLLAEQVSLLTLAFVFISSLLVGFVVLLCVLLPIFNLAAVSIVSTIFFYLILSAWYHRLEGTFEWDTMFQYGLFAAMALILILYL